MRTRIVTTTISFAEWLADKVHDFEIETDWSNWYLGTREGHHLIGRRVLVDVGGSAPEVLKFNSEGDAELWMVDNLLPDEFDAFISYDRHGVTAYCRDIDELANGVTFPTFRRAVAALRLAMHRSGLHPNVWITGEHGPSCRQARFPLGVNS